MNQERGDSYFQNYQGVIEAQQVPMDKYSMEESQGDYFTRKLKHSYLYNRNTSISKAEIVSDDKPDESKDDRHISLFDAKRNLAPIMKPSSQDIGIAIDRHLTP